MKVTAIISEYNPLHNGHIYQLKRAKEETDADYIIVVMSGDHVQRGTPSVISKYTRAKSALLAGADLVIELPLYYSTGSIEYFSTGAVSLINSLNTVTKLSFGSECGDIALLKKASIIMSDINASTGNIKTSLKEGNNYAKALLNSDGLPKEVNDIIKSPNNLLGIHYLNALNSLNSKITPHTVKRIMSEYHDDNDGAISSTAVRAKLTKETPNAEALLKQMPVYVFEELIKYLDKYPAISEDDYSMLLFYKIHEVLNVCSSDGIADELTKFTDVSVSLAHKIANKYKNASSYSDLCSMLKSKNYTYTRISRALLHILLNISKAHMDEYIQDGYNYYARILGFRKDSVELLHELKNKSSIPLITKTADAHQILERFYLQTDSSVALNNIPKYTHAIRMFDEDISASELYNKAACSISRQPFISEYEQNIVII